MATYILRVIQLKKVEKSSDSDLVPEGKVFPQPGELTFFKSSSTALGPPPMDAGQWWQADLCVTCHVCDV